MFHALLVRKEGDRTSTAVEQLDDASLPLGDVTVAVSHSSLNYKDALVLAGQAGLVKSYPHVPGIDMAGVVAASDISEFKPGDDVLLTGWRVGELHWGGYAQQARVKAEWLTPMPAGLDASQVMTIGTAGFAAMLAIDALEQHGLNPAAGEVVVTGASGGVGTIATTILATLGYEVAAVTGKPDAAEELLELGAARIMTRDELTAGAGRPLSKARFAGCIDSVAGAMLPAVLSQLQYNGSVAAVGLAGGDAFEGSVVPFLLRGVNLLGIDSVMCPAALRDRLWRRLATELPMAKLNPMTQTVTLNDLPQLARNMLAGKLRGRTVVDLSQSHER